MSVLEQVLSEIKDATYIISIPLEKFDALKDLDNFVNIMNKNGIGVAIKAEYSNFYQGVLVEVYNKKTCTVKVHSTAYDEQVVKELAAAKEDIRKLLCSEYGSSCQFCVHDENEDAMCCNIGGSGSWCCENAKWKGCV